MCLAMSALAVLAGASDDDTLTVCLSDDTTLPDGQNGWVAADNGEGEIVIYNGGKPVAEIMWSARGWWNGYGTVLSTGTRYYTEGSNTDLTYNGWALR